MFAIRLPRMTPRLFPNLALALLATLALTGCAVNIMREAPASQLSDESLTVVTGRMNYVIDGHVMTPYGAFRPAWPAPFMNAVNLGSGEVHAFPAVEAQQGRFRWQVPPGAYVVTRIGFGTYTDDTYISWPRIALCVPKAPGQAVYAGHLRLEGQRYAEPVTLSTGTSYVARGVRYTFKVEDEGSGAPGAVRHLMRHVPDMPIGDHLQAQWKADATALARRLCPGLQVQAAP